MLTVPWFVTHTVQDLFRIQIPRLNLQDDTEDPGPSPVPDRVVPAVSRPVEAEVTQTHAAHSQTQTKQAVSSTPQVAARGEL